MNSDQAKAIHMRDLLAALSHQPVQVQRGELWFYSPFREETDASFKITRDGRGWYDHGEGAGGNIVDFVMRLYGTDVSGALTQLDDLNIANTVRTGDPDDQHEFWQTPTQLIEVPAARKSEPKVTESEIAVTRVQPLQNRALVAYLKKRGIDTETAAVYVDEIYYTQKGNPYFALAFANESGGYELRNPYFKGTHDSKDISIVRAGEGDSQSVAVFEGFMDFLSACMVAKRKPVMDCIILNSVAMRDRAVEAIQQMDVGTLYLYLDRDERGRQLTEELTAQLSDLTVHDQSGLYAEHKDLNEYLMERNKARALAK
ncbi:MAG: toprim domain-containing protein [Chloroflexota bacterium]